MIHQQISFREEQKFRQWWLWLLVMPIIILPFIGLFVQVFFDKPIGSKPAPDVALILPVIVSLIIVTLLYYMKLTTTIDASGISFVFFPFVKKKTIGWGEVQSAEVINYGFVGGWGIRFWTKYGTVYNVRGRKGLAIVLKNGKKLLIGTQKEHELQRAVGLLTDVKTPQVKSNNTP